MGMFGCIGFWGSDEIDNTVSIVVTTEIDGTIVLELAGWGTVNVDWGDGNNEDVELLVWPDSNALSHNYDAGGTITITNATVLTHFTTGDNYGISDCVISQGCVNLRYMQLINASLDEATVNELLILANTYMPYIVQIDLTTSPVTAPSGAGITAKNSLIAKGVAVATN